MGRTAWGGSVKVPKSGRHSSRTGSQRSSARSSIPSSPVHASRQRRGGMHVGRREMALGGILMVVFALTLVVGLTKGASSTTGAGGGDVARFDTQVRRSLSPLLVHVRALPQALKSLAGSTAGGVNTALAGETARWVDDDATARDLVRRLHPPAVADGAVIQNLYVVGAMFYTEAARAAGQAASSPAARQEVARSGLRLLLLGDRTFDVGRRLLLPYEVRGEGEHWVFPLAVPDFAKEGLDPDHPGPPADGRSGFEPAGIPSVADSQWMKREGPEVETALRVLGQVRSLFYTGPRDPATLDTADEGRHALVSASTSLAQPVPSSQAAAEGVVALRLAMLTEVEALDALHWVGADQQEPARLRLIGEQMWTLGTGLMQGAGMPTDRIRSVTDPEADPGLLLAGGRFGGHPPALRPGQDVGAGIPSGLPNVNLRTVVGASR